MKTSKLTGPALDWAVAKCEGTEVEYLNDGITKCLLQVAPFTGRFAPSTDWAQGGPIIEREWIKVSPYHNQGGWWAEHAITKSVFDGPTPLIAAMRCFVASKLGDEVEIPEELK